MTDNRHDEHPAPGITVRTYGDEPFPAVVYVGGWRVGTYKTQRGIDAAIHRHREAAAEGAARHAAVAAEPCPTCGRRGDEHYAPFGDGFMPTDHWHVRFGPAAPDRDNRVDGMPAADYVRFLNEEAAKAREPVTAHRENGDIVCACGNTPGDDGFATCLPDGTEVEPLADGPWAGHYRCGRCGAVHHYDTLPETVTT